MMDCILYKSDDLTRKSMLIDKALKKESKKSKVYRVLIIGQSETGKSTLLKLIKILHGGGYSATQLDEYKNQIRWNMLQHITKYLEILMKHEEYESWDDKEKIEALTKIKKGDTLSNETCEFMQQMWKNLRFQEFIRVQYETFETNRHLQFFLDSMERIVQDEYRPTDADILRLHSDTKTPSEIEFEANNSSFKATDVGEMHRNVAKWIHVFDNINGIIFCVALSDYASVENNKNKLTEAVKLLNILCGNPFFSKKDIHVIFNKKDVFAGMLENIPFSAYFSDYEGDEDELSIVEYISDMFCKGYENRLNSYFTNALDIESFNPIFKEIFQSRKTPVANEKTPSKEKTITAEKNQKEKTV